MWSGTCKYPETKRVYGYAVGLYSSRRIAKACVERVDFMATVALQAPDFRTISEFRRRHLAALSALFVQVLKLCEAAGLVKLGHVALDGTQIKANASKHKAMSYERMSKREAELQAEERNRKGTRCVSDLCSSASLDAACRDSRRLPETSSEEAKETR